MSNSEFYKAILSLIRHGEGWCDKYESDTGMGACVRRKLREVQAEVIRRKKIHEMRKRIAKPAIQIHRSRMQLVDLIKLDRIAGLKELEAAQ